MRLLGWEISRSRSPAEAAKDLQPILNAMYELGRRLKALEDDQAARELRLGELADKIRRHFARVQELDRRQRRREEGDDDVDDMGDGDLDELARLKLSGKGI